ncbi:MAG TPA: polysaccharide lyase family protein [Acidobacteriaceae bacterium]|nr:polysaccharide lyase family protein [Acidobacteriaceae bacterium]
MIRSFRAALFTSALFASVSVFGQSSAPPVIVTDSGSSFVLANGYLTATINKKTGDMTSLRVNGLETQGYVSGHHAGYWEQNPNGAARMDARLTIDPATNAGERGEVSIKGWSDGKNLNGERRLRPPTPGAGADTSSSPNAESDAEIPPEQRRQVQLPPGVQRNRGTATGPRPGGFTGTRGPGLLVDMEIRYALGRGEKGIYTYAIFTHEPSYGATQIGESRYGMKLNGDVFDWLSIDSQRNGPMPTGKDWDLGTDLNMKEARRLTTGVKAGQVEHKYDYCADQFDTPAFGWASTKQHVGIYYINPSSEFLSSGPFHFELMGHLDDGDGGDPTLLDYWRGTHYGGSELPVAAGEDWTKVVGPIFIYVPTGGPPNDLFAEAKRQAKVEAAKWPYTWVNGVDYPKATERGTISGQLVLHDPQAHTSALPNLMVGLAYPDRPQPEQSAASQPGQPFGGRGPARLTWQNDAKHYEFWVHGTPDGRFTIPNVRPGTYQLHAIADGVLGEYAKADITVASGGKVNLGKLEWVPVRYGKQLWQIGIPNRSASEFLRGDDHWHWGEYVEYAKLFPNDVDFTIGKSDFRKDWFIYQVPHDTNPDDTLGRGPGRETPWRVHFNLAEAPASGERGVLRLALAGVSARSIAVQVNGKDAGTVTGLVYNATINRDGVEGSWVEKDVDFEASLMRVGENTLTLTVPAGGITSGVAYDVVRLELAPANAAVK